MVKESKWTVVQHSGSGYGGKPAFARGLEVRAVGSPRLLNAVVKGGGLLFGDYKEAYRYCYDEMYGEGAEGLVPRAPGRFHPTLKVDGLALYIPKARPPGPPA